MAHYTHVGSNPMCAEDCGQETAFGPVCACCLESLKAWDNDPSDPDTGWALCRGQGLPEESGAGSSGDPPATDDQGAPPSGTGPHDMDTMDGLVLEIIPKVVALVEAQTKAQCMDDFVLEQVAREGELWRAVEDTIF